MNQSWGWAALSLIVGILLVVSSSEGQFRNSILGGPIPGFGPAVEAVADLRYPGSLRSSAVRPRRQFFFGGQNKQSTFSLLRQLISETATETRTAFNQIGDILGSQFGDSATSTTTTTPPPPVEVNGTTSTTSTTEAPYRISRQDFLNILQRNAVGLGRLFRKQYDTAIQDSSVNLNRFKQELKMAVRPFLDPAPPTTTETASTSS